MFPEICMQINSVVIQKLDKLTSKMYAKTINIFYADKNVFVKYQAQGGVNPNPPLRRCDVSVKKIFRTWLKTLLHCGFG